MWNVRLISGLASGLVCGGAIVLAVVSTTGQSANAVRSQDYTPAQFISVLNGLGYAVPLTAPITDPIAQQAIRDFQVQFQLPVDGTLNVPTQDRAAEILRSLQSGLNRTVKPSPQLPGSQFYGKQTEEAVRQFQQQNRLPVTGIATLETRQRLNNIIADADPRTTPTAPSTPTAQTDLSIYTEAEIKAVLSGFGYDINRQAR